MSVTGELDKLIQATIEDYAVCPLQRRARHSCGQGVRGDRSLMLVNDGPRRNSMPAWRCQGCESRQLPQLLPSYATGSVPVSSTKTEIECLAPRQGQCVCIWRYERSFRRRRGRSNGSEGPGEVAVPGGLDRALQASQGRYQVQARRLQGSKHSLDSCRTCVY